MAKRILLLLFLVVASAVAAWTVLHFFPIKWPQDPAEQSKASNTIDSWATAIEKAKADRGEPAGTSAGVVIPPELRHYSDRHWFLATQVAEIEKYPVHTCQDFVDLAGMIERGEMVRVPGVTETYVLLGVGNNADERAFSRYQDDHSIEIYNEVQLQDTYRRLSTRRSQLLKEIENLTAQSGVLKKRDRAKQRELQKQIAGRRQELGSIDQNKARLDEFYSSPASRQKLFSDYESLQRLANKFDGRSFNLDQGSDRQAMKVGMLSSLRPEALKVLEELALAYQRQFGRPLLVSSLVRPEEYQRALRRVNRNAVLIDTPPHSTGLAFDIDYRYMSAAEQTFLMAELARLKNAGRVEVLRERNANFHVFAFLKGTRPSDDLITAALEKAGAPVEEAHHAESKPIKKVSKSLKAKKQPRQSKKQSRNSKARKRR